MARPSNPELPAAILEAAEKRVAASGHDGLNMRDLAADVGVTPAALYYYFASKERILLELRLRAACRLSETMRKIDGSHGARAAIRALGVAYIAFAEEHPHLYGLLVETRIGAELASGEETETLRLPYDAARRLLENLVDRGLCVCDPDGRAAIGWILLHGFCSLLAAGNLEAVSRLDRETLKETFLEYFGTGPFIDGEPGRTAPD
ncbi:MAG: TetR/AcrR family transcriptional regulator [Candidatus Eisenbacteria bacterium]